MNVHGKTLLAPLTKGGNLPFRRLCVDFGAEITMSEMAYAKQVVRGSRPEMALLRRHPSESCFGVQIAAGNPKDAAAAARIAADRGAAFIDLNAGCPIHDTVRRGMGATLLQRPKALSRIVEAMVEAIELPVTVKIRSGWKEGEINASEIARIAEEAGASMLTLHARTREQRYTKAADWGLVGQIVAERSIPVIGNGDLLCWHEAEERRRQSGCAGVMVGRGVLIKPWLFQEIATRSTWLPTAEERVEIYLRFVGYCKEHFGDDEKGRKKAMRFLPWHFGFFARWRPMPEDRFIELAREHPLIQTRIADQDEIEPIDALLRDSREELHAQVADALWDAADRGQAIEGLRALASRLPDDSKAGPDDFAMSCG